MDVFLLRRDVVNACADCARSFITVCDERIREHVDRNLDEGFL